MQKKSNSVDSRQAASVLSMILELLREDEQRRFWDWAASEVRALRNPQRIEQLRQGLAEVRSKIAGRKLPWPVASRSLSSDELANRLHSTKRGLLEVPSGTVSVLQLLPTWVAKGYSQAVCATLDALGCHHVRGVLEGDVPPPLSPMALRIKLEPVQTAVGHRDLALVLLALKANGLLVDDHWHWLMAEAQRRHDALLGRDACISTSEVGTAAPASSDGPAGPEPMQPVPISTDSGSGPAVDLDGLSSQCMAGLHATWQRLKEALLAAQDMATKGELPDLGAVLSAKDDMNVLLQSLADLFGSELHSVADAVQAQLDWSTRRSAARESEGRRRAAMAVANWALLLEHVDRNSVGLLNDVLAMARRLTNLASAGDLPSTLEHQDLEVLTALQRLVADRQQLDESTASELFAKVQSHLGIAVAMAAVMGRLQVSANPQPIDAALPEVVEPLSPALAKHVDPAPLQDQSGGEAVLDIDDQPSCASPVEVLEAPVAELPAMPKPQPEGRGLGGVIEGPKGVSAESDLNHVIADSEQSPAVAMDGHSVDLVSTAGDTRSDSSAAIPSIAVALPSGFGQYCAAHWINSSGQPEAAPWLLSGYVSDTEGALARAWEEGQYAEAHLHAMALQRLGTTNAVPLTLFDAALSVLSAPAGMHAGLDSDRASRLLSYSTPPLGGVSELFLEGLRPNQPVALADSDLDRLSLTLAPKGSNAARVAKWMLQCWRQADDPIELMTRHLDSGPEVSLEQLREQVVEAWGNFEQSVSYCWQAAAGRILRNHCRVAWTRFMEQALGPFRDEYMVARTAPANEAGALALAMFASLKQVHRRYVSWMDSGDVRLSDRKVADSTEAHLTEQAMLIANVLQQIGRAHARHGGRSHPHLPVPDDAVMALLSESQALGNEGLCGLLLKAVLRRPDARSPWGIRLSSLGATPVAALYLNDAMFDADDSAATVPMGAVRDARALSALWRMRAETDHLVVGSSVGATKLEWLQRALAAADIGLLSRFSGTGTLPSDVQARLHAEALEREDRDFELHSRFDRAWTACVTLVADPDGHLDQLRSEIERSASSPSQPDDPVSVLLRPIWLADCVQAAEKYLDASRAKLLSRAQAELDAGASKQVADALAAGDERAALAHFDGNTFENPITLNNPARITLWREEAQSKFPLPLQQLRQGALVESEPARAFAQEWLSALRDDKVRTPAALAQLLTADFGRTERAELRKNDVPTARSTTISCPELRQYLRRQRLNPSFLPQLANWQDLVLLPAPLGGQGAATGQWIGRIAADTKQVVTAFVAPGLAIEHRRANLAEFRRRSLLAAIIDDVDACRLLEVARRDSSQALPALVEIVLEQLRLGMVAPFSTQDGQHIRMEAFVGRASEAEELALTPRHSRIFSGRKLGKSALLKFIENRYDKHQLSSGNTLHVLFATIAGADTEDAVARVIIDLMVNRFGLPGAAATELAPHVRLKDFMQGFLSERPKDSVLLVLDEADSFVEAQLSEFDAKREASVSFYLHKGLAAEQDANGHPRVRAVFAGYRATNIHAAVWANAGDTLMLKPLSKSRNEAELLVTGLFGRIGVDVAEHASYIARRCGRQPAVLLKFGAALLRQLDRADPAQRTERVRVSATLVESALADREVVDEIRTVVANNFQGDRLAHVIFDATLLCMKELPPSTALQGGADAVISRLKQIVPQLEGLPPAGISLVDYVNTRLHDFVNRELLEMRESHRFNGRVYRLQCQHFMPVLTVGADLEGRIREQLQIVRQQASPAVAVHGALPMAGIEALRFALELANTTLCRFVAVGSHWTTPIVDARCGIAARLGAGGARECRDLPSAETALNDGCNILECLPTSAWQSLASHQGPRPVVAIGGIGWLRNALSHCLSGEEPPVEYVGQGALSKETVQWWIERGRALHVTDPTAAADLWWTATDGIPLLLCEMDKRVQGALGGELDLAEIGRASRQLHDDLTNLVQRWMTDAEVLTPREWELFVVCCESSAVLGDIDLERDVRDALVADIARSYGVAAPHAGPHDRVALATLLLSGMLPADAEGTVLGARGLGRINVNAGSTRHTVAKLAGEALRQRMR